MGALFTKDDAASVLIGNVLALVLTVIVVLTHPRNRTLFAANWSAWLYLVPLLAGITLPFHYWLDLPVATYMFWITVSVFWQDYLTFGLLQMYLGERLRPWAVLVASGLIFWTGHALFLPEKFGPVHLIPSLAFLAVGLLFASLASGRARCT